MKKSLLGLMVLSAIVFAVDSTENPSMDANFGGTGKSDSGGRQ